MHYLRVLYLKDIIQSSLNSFGKKKVFRIREQIAYNNNKALTNFPS